jgi:hypothetical protein
MYNDYMGTAREGDCPNYETWYSWCDTIPHQILNAENFSVWIYRSQARNSGCTATCLDDPEESDRTDIIKWTEEHRTEVQIPKEFLEAAQKYGLDRVVEGEFQDEASSGEGTEVSLLASSDVERPTS